MANKSIQMYNYKSTQSASVILFARRYIDAWFRYKIYVCPSDLLSVRSVALWHCV